MTEEKCWRILNSIALLVCISVLCVRFYIGFFQNLTNTNVSKLFLYFNYFIHFISIVAMLISYLAPFRFIIYAFLLILWGLSAIFLYDFVLGTILFLSSTIFLYRFFPHVFGNIKRLFLLGILEFLVCQILIYLMIQDVSAIFPIVSKFIVIILVAFVNLIALRPLYSKPTIILTKKFDCSPYNFSERQIEVLKLVLDGEKYTHIANQCKINESTVKRDVKEICNKLDVLDRTELIIKYGGCEII